MRIAISGGAGFVGGHLTNQLRAAGHEVAVMGRSGSIPFSLEREFPPERLTGVDCLIHAAYDFAADDDRNVSGSIRLIDAAKAAGVRSIVFISSLSAFEGCKSKYGAAKLAVEKHTAAAGGCNVRLGFVCDDSTRGLSGSLKKLAALPVVPLPGGGKQNLFTIRAEDLGPAFLRIIEDGNGGLVNLAHPEPVSLASMMKGFARQQGKSVLFLPFPWRLLWLPLYLTEAAGLRMKFRSDSLVSLMNQNPSPDFNRLGEWGIRPGKSSGSKASERRA